MTLKDFLENSQLFGHVAGEALQELMSICREEKVKRGSYIFKEGEPAKFLYLLSEGRVALEMRLERPDGSMTPAITVASVGPGEAFGWSAIVESHMLTLSAKVIEDSGIVLIEGQALRRLLSRRSRVGYVVMANVAKLLGERLAATREAFVYERSWVLKGKPAR